MRKCRSGFPFRLLPPPRSPFLMTGLKIVTTVGVIATLFLYVSERYEKESLIKFALGSGIAEEMVRPDNETLIFNGLLSDSDGRLKVKYAFIVIVVTSLPENLERRNVIRNTWASKAHEHGTQIVFFMGRPAMNDMKKTLIDEASHYKDMVIDDFRESYYALAIKTLRLLKYFKLHHPKSKFLVKTDDDVFVNVPNLVNYCYSINKRFDLAVSDGRSQKGVNNNRDYFVGGVIHGDRGPHTWNPFSKWYVPSDLWRSLYRRVLEAQKKVGERRGVIPPVNEVSYPPYAEGNFYVLSADAATDILNVSTIVPLYHLEDVHVTGVLTTWMLNIEKDEMPYISSSSNFFPRLSYLWYKLFTASPKDLIAFHCDNHVELISLIYKESM